MQLSFTRALCAGTAVLLFGCVLAAGQSESLGDVARRERERRAGRATHPRVLTNEDLQREKILDTPAIPVAEAAPASESPGSAAAPKAAEVPAIAMPAAASSTVPFVPNTFSLGEYARRLRQERAREREARALAEGSTGAPVASPLSRVVVAPGTTPRPLASVTVEPRAAQRKSDRAPRRARRVPGEDIARGADRSRYTLRRGDSLWKVARVLFGDARLWKQIWRANPQLANPNRVRAGKTLRLPNDETLARARARLSAPGVARVRGSSSVSAAVNGDAVSPAPQRRTATLAEDSPR
jgi:nucleoid-associated protein YgaU